MGRLEEGTWIWIAIFGTYLPFFFIQTVHRVRNRTAMTPVRRLLWTIWVGHFLATVTTLVLMRLWTGDDYVDALQRSYAIVAILMGLAYFIQGCLIAGWQYLAGVAWMALALLMGLVPEFAALLFGIGMSVSTAISGVRLLRLAKPVTQNTRTGEEETRSYQARR